MVVKYKVQISNFIRAYSILTEIIAYLVISVYKIMIIYLLLSQPRAINMSWIGVNIDFLDVVNSGFNHDQIAL